METQLLCTAQMLARRLGLPRKWLVDEANAGRLPALRAERKLVFNLEAVRRVLAERAAAEKPTLVEGDQDGL